MRGTEPPFVDQLAAIITASLIDDGLVNADTARVAAASIIERLRRGFAGQACYISAGKQESVERMRQVVLERWDGRNTRLLCNQLGVTESRLRQLREEALARKK